MQTSEHIIRAATVVVFVEGLRQRNPNAVVNTVFMFLGTYLPSVVERIYDVEFRPWQRVYTECAMLAHAVGMLDLYDEIWWWDHLTHVLSATLLGGFVHTASRHRGRNPARDVLASIVSGGLLWEAMELAIHRVSEAFGIEPMLVYYGPRDTLGDLVFNLFGALLVFVFGDRLLENFTQNAD
ncbi:hypothetical protein [Haloprofundus salinisoli]|uniref:hypothetical protein n=1 Tax=Haloprofundus salinisoli TaxID=2876193 RepID=UPI001CC9B3C1|nr:hypothetical protein [Haloprofundus salinisoli]